MNIGFFDSGIGGLTVLKKALEVLPDENYIYYADTDNVPYGTRKKEEVRKFVFDAVKFIISKGAEALVIACNNATSVAIEDLRKEYSIPIIGMEPAVKLAVEKNGNKNKRVLVVATALTLSENKYRDLVNRIDDEKIIDSVPLPGLVWFAEKMQFDEKTVMEYLRKELKDFDLGKYGTVVLGCTHFVYFKNAFRKLFPPAVDVIDGNTGTVNNLKKKIHEVKLQKQGTEDPGKIPATTNDRVQNYTSRETFNEPAKKRINLTFYNSGRLVEKEDDLERYKKLFEQVPD